MREDFSLSSVRPNDGTGQLAGPREMPKLDILLL